MKNEKYHIVGTVPKSYRKIVERGKIGTPNPQIHQHFSLLSWLGTGTSIKKWQGYTSFMGPNPKIVLECTLLQLIPYNINSQ